MDVMVIEVICAECGVKALKDSGGVNRARRNNAPLYCSRACAGLARRTNTPRPGSDAYRQQKADYDRRRRQRLGDVLRESKRAAYYAALSADPEAVRSKQRRNREQRKEAHNEYCRRPEYVEKKREYDKRYRAREFPGFEDAHPVLVELQNVICKETSREERSRIRYARRGGNKAQQRKRAAQRRHAQG